VISGLVVNSVNFLEPSSEALEAALAGGPRRRRRLGLERQAGRSERGSAFALPALVKHVSTGSRFVDFADFSARVASRLAALVVLTHLPARGGAARGGLRLARLRRM
jgi:hypothetical protein